MADAIYGLVKYPALSKFLKKNALAQIKKMKWDKPAADLSDIYKEVVYAALDEEKDVRMNVGHNVINQTKKSTNENNMPEL
jgi:basic membrane lipoprotein Med (substrate-binding protein (PBP1-ABC) superfamily)